MNVDIENIIQGVGSDARIGTQFFSPSLGYGGSCLPKDTLSLLHSCEEKGITFNLLKTTVQVNENRKMYFINKLQERFILPLHERNESNRPGVNDLPESIGILGLSFKAKVFSGYRSHKLSFGT